MVWIKNILPELEVQADSDWNQINPETNEELQVIIQDNLTGLLSFNCVALWHIVTD